MNLIREHWTDQGTPGKLSVGGLVTLELPWRDNKKEISCIPTGVYHLELYQSPQHGEVLRVLNVPDRDDILIHVGNRAGDVSLGYKSDSKGCILVGSEAGKLEGQTAIFYSRAALRRLLDDFKAGKIDPVLSVLFSDVDNRGIV